MNIERIDVNEIKDLNARKCINQLIECIFEMNRDINRKLDNLSSQNVKTLDFNITKVSNLDCIMGEYAKKE